jgi:membrane-associated phospholipid phosphatase
LSAPPDQPDSSRYTARLLVAGGLLLALLALAALGIDLPLARAVHTAELPGDLARLIRLAEVFGYGGTVILIILVAGLLDPRGWRVAVRLAICALGSGVVADLLKLLVVVRLRPAESNLEGSAGETFIAWLPLWADDRLQELGLEYGSKLQSFPSAHTATAVGLAIGLGTLYPRGWWLFAIFAALAGLQRIASQSHFLSDVLAGAAIGCFLGAGCTGAARLGRWLARLESYAP